MKFAISDLTGLSDDFIGRLEKVKGQEDTHVYISMKYPEVLPALRLVQNEDVRFWLARARASMVQDSNGKLLDELIEKR